MSGYLDEFETKIFNIWAAEVPGDIREHFTKYILTRTEQKLLFLNFHPKLHEILIEMKHLTAMNYPDLPEPAIALFELTEPLWVWMEVCLYLIYIID